MKIYFEELEYSSNIFFKVSKFSILKRYDFMVPKRKRFVSNEKSSF